jgi:phage major head subunit gpT-like protein
MMTSAQFAELMEPKLREVFFQTYDELPEQYTDVFHVDSSKKQTETDYHVIGLGMWDKFNGAVQYEDFEPGKKVTYTHEMYSKGIEIPTVLAEDDLYSVIGPAGAGTKHTKGLARGARARVETVAADTLNNAFTTNGYDGVPLFSDAHPLANGATVDNRITDALSEASLKTARLLMRGQVDDKGIKIQAIGDTLVVPADLEYTALEITQSELKTGTANNDKNVIGKKIKKLVVLDYLTDTNNWFLLDSSLHQLNFFWRVKPEFEKDTDIDHFLVKFVGRMRFSVGYSDWRGTVGAIVA